MKMILHFEFPLEPFNSLVRAGTAATVLKSILAEIKPESVHFYAPHGNRGGIMIINLDDAAKIPSIAEPLFLKLNAKCEFYPAMTPDDLGRSQIDQLGARWG
jgi:hypothetical protein